MTGKAYKLTLSVVFLVAGLTLLATAAVAGRNSRHSGIKDGGTLRLNISTSDVQSIDPGIDYEFLGWALENATCLKLVNYPDKAGRAGTVVIPEAATALPRVSADGKTYTFTIRRGLKFNTGEAVTAATFANLINRDLNPKLVSPSVAFLGDVVGADAVVNKKAKTASGIRANGNRLTIHLTKQAPDFVARMAMNFFCAIPIDTPVPLKGNTMPSAGPYYIASRSPNRGLILQRNPNYHGSRPHHVDRMSVTVNTNISQSLLQVRSGEADYDVYGLPPTASGSLSKQFGVNRGRFFVHTQNAVNYLAINTRRVKDVSIRKAINFALDRSAIVRQAGVLGGEPTDQILPPTLRGYEDAHLYPLTRPDVARAKALMKGRHLKMKLYSPNDSIPQAQDQVITANLKAIGIDVTARPLPFSSLLALIGDPTESYDLVLIGWLADYPDPVDFINILFDGNHIAAQNNNNLALLDDPVFNKRMEAAERLAGAQRYATFGRLDIDIMRNAAPWASLYIPTVREFVSARVGCYIFQPAFALIDLANVCLK
jgi:peptide/nickel transport system substrate-binding protein